jgi:type IV pilus assembly protein PilP
MNCKSTCASLSALLLVLLLTSCAERETPDQLRAQLETIRRGTPAIAPPIPPESDFVPYAYAVANDETAMTPFGRPTLVPIDANADERPRQRGTKQPLEDVPLEAIRMVGTLSRDGRTDALLQVDKIVYPSRTGDYLGQNFGVIRRVEDGRVELEELIRNNGDWEKRMATLELQGRGK